MNWSDAWHLAPGWGIFLVSGLALALLWRRTRPGGPWHLATLGLSTDLRAWTASLASSVGEIRADVREMSRETRETRKRIDNMDAGIMVLKRLAIDGLRHARHPEYIAPSERRPWTMRPGDGAAESEESKRLFEDTTPHAQRAPKPDGKAP